MPGWQASSCPFSRGTNRGLENWIKLPKPTVSVDPDLLLCATREPRGPSCQAGSSLPLGPTPLKAHIGVDLRQPGEQVQYAGDGADDKTNDLLLSEGLRKQKGVLSA